MSELEIADYSDYEVFAREWQAPGGGDDDTAVRLRWQLLGQLAADELLVQLPEWLAEEKIGFVDGATPTEFIGRLDRETEQAIRFVESAAAPPLLKRAHRIHKLEEGIAGALGDDDRQAWLTDRL